MKLIRLLVLLLLASPAFATFTKVQNVVNTGCGAGSTSCVLTVASTGTGNVIVIGFGQSAASAKSITSVSGGGTYTHCTTCTASQTVGGSNSADISYTLNSTSGATSITVNYTSSASPTVEMAEYSFTGTVSLDVGNFILNGTNTLRGGVDLTALAGANDLLYQVLAMNQTVTAINGAYSSTTDVGLHFGFAVAINTTTGTAPTWTFSGNAFSAGSGLAIKEVSAGGVVRHKAQVINQ